MSIQKRNILAAAIACAVAAPAAQAVDLLYQPFNIGVTEPPGCHTEEFGGGPGTYPYPSGWLLFNVDNRTPAGAVAYVNDAWEVREDFSFNVTQCAAFSTSWYSPAGQADDWTWSPAVTIPAGATLGWRAIAYDPDYRDGYEVRVKTDAVPTQANQLTSDVVFSTAAEQTAWTDHSLSLAAYAPPARWRAEFELGFSCAGACTPFDAGDTRRRRVWLLASDVARVARQTV